MADITAADVKALRERTGLPMMDCKAALTEAGGDADKAVEILRKRGAAAADKRAGREVGEGRIACYVDKTTNTGAILEFRCETAPVANNPEFRELAEKMAAAAAGAAGGGLTPDALLALPAPGAGGRTCKDLLMDLVNKIRENMRLARVERLQGRLGSYVHFNGKIGVLLQVEGAGATDELLSDLCMHITAMKPLALRREDIDAALIAKEREIAAEQVRASGKPENMIPKIVEGKMNRWYSERVLLEQEFANADKFKGKIEQYLKKFGDVKIIAYRRMEVGE